MRSYSVNVSLGEPPTRRAARDIAYSQLRQLIIERELKPGATITEKELAAVVGMSRTPLREGIKALETQGFVTRLANGRLMVTPLTVRELEDLFGVRAAIERLIVKSVASSATDGDIQTVLSPFVSAIRRSLDSYMPEARLYGESFHYGLTQLCQNRLASNILWELRDRIARYRKIGPDRCPERRTQAAREHLRIYELIAAHEAEEAARAMEEHIQHSLEVALRFLPDDIALENATGRAVEVSQ